MLFAKNIKISPNISKSDPNISIIKPKITILTPKITISSDVETKQCLEWIYLRYVNYVWSDDVMTPPSLWHCLVYANKIQRILTKIQLVTLANHNAFVSVCDQVTKWLSDHTVSLYNNTNINYGEENIARFSSLQECWFITGLMG